ncbi:MAG: nuclear transport factor 2 family protein [Gammaproteobacteria bacterium]
MTTLEQRLILLERQVRDLQSAQAIRATLSQYAIAVDEKRPELLRSLFTDDAAVEIPAWKIDVAGIADVMAFYATYWARFDYPRRYYANEDIRIDGDSATAFLYWHVTQERAGQSYLGWGTYHWRFRLIDDRWRIKGVLITLLAMTTLAAGWAGENKFVDP